MLRLLLAEQALQRLRSALVRACSARLAVLITK